MNRTILTISLTAALAAATFGCGEVDPDEPGSADDETVVQNDDSACEHCEDWELQEPAEKPPSTPCEPTAATYAFDPPPELPDDVLDDACPLEAEIVHDHHDSDRTTTFSRTGQTVEQTTIEEGRLVEATDFGFDDGALVFVEHRVYHEANQWTEYDRVETDRWEFDDRGRLTEKTYERVRTDTDEQLDHRVVQQTWEGDRLAERVELEGVDERERRELYYDYDDRDRLTGATYRENDELIGETDWTYTDGRPDSVERRAGGELVEHQQWTYRDDGTLRARTVETSRLTRAVDHDDYALTEPGHGLSPWRAHDRQTAPNAHRRADGSDSCYELPHSAGHGYPVDEPAYIVGLEAGEPMPFDAFGHLQPPIGLTDVAGHYARPGYAHPPRLHYGHVGLSTNWPSGLGQGHTTAEIEYDDNGRMVTEHLEWHRTDDETLDIERERDFTDDRLVTDHIELQRGDDSADATLEFEYGDDRRIRRRLRNGEEVAHQSWQFADGRAVELEIHAGRETLEWGDRPLTALFSEPEKLGDFDGLHTEGVVHTRGFDDRDRLVEAGVASAAESSDWSVETTRTHGEHGPVERVETRSSEDGETKVERRAGRSYDDQGRLVAEYVDIGDDGTIDTELVYTRDDHGRIVEVVDDGHTGRETTNTDRVFACH